MKGAVYVRNIIISPVIFSLYKQFLLSAALTIPGIFELLPFPWLFFNTKPTFQEEESLKFPVQETHMSLEEIQSHLEGICASIIDFEKRSQHVDAFFLESKVAKQNQIIEDLKVELSRQMENGKKICNLENFVQEMKESNAKLESERDKYRSLSLQLQQKIEQIEFEPSVEVMQVASTQQEKVIEGLNNELIKAKDRITSLSEENGCLMQKVNTLNEICTKMNHDASQLSIVSLITWQNLIILNV